MYKTYENLCIKLMYEYLLTDVLVIQPDVTVVVTTGGVDDTVVDVKIAALLMVAIQLSDVTVLLGK